MKDLIDKIRKADIAYYANDAPIMSDKEYDELYNKLLEKEKESGIILAGSPTQKVSGYILDGFKKVEHSKPMLSSDKTKDPKDIKRFIGQHDFYGSFKLDGLTLVVKYENGEFKQGVTRGNGIIGEDVTNACKFIHNLPMKIPFSKPLELRGECVISWDEFNRINSTLEKQYSHPRNLAAGTLRNLDLNVIKNRKLSFVVFECVSDINIESKYETLSFLSTIGFETVERHKNKIENIIEIMQPEYSIYPCDGIIFEIDNNSVSKTLGATGHHENCRMALKWADDLYNTYLRDIEWATSRTGLINPVAIFDEVDLDGALTTRATLHNISYIEDLELGIGDEIQIYRANMVIPKVHENLTRSNTWKLPDKCPCCNGPVKVKNDNGSKTLHCVNNTCSAKLLYRAVNFVSKKGMNIDGLSEATLEKFIEYGWINDLSDIYDLDKYYDDLKKMDGFGTRSVSKLKRSIENSKDVDLQHFITALGIPGIGEGQSKVLIKKFNSWEEFSEAGIGNYDFSRISGIGEVLNENIHEWFNNGYISDNIMNLLTKIHFKSSNNKNGDILNNMTFVITGSVYKYKSRDELKKHIESLGGKVSGSISSKTNYLINNDSTSKSSKNLKAIQLNIPIITEEKFIEMIKEV